MDARWPSCAGLFYLYPAWHGAPDHASEHYMKLTHAMNQDCIRPAIVGAGPAGIVAAQTLLAHGLCPVLIDEAPKPGGQIYRQVPDGMQRSAKALYGFEHRKAQEIHLLGQRLAQQLDYRDQTLVWNIEGNRLFLQSASGLTDLAFSHLILATGATDRILPFPGWLLPGVFTLGGAQVALKHQGCAIGRHVVLAGTGPLLYLVAWQYAKAGVPIAAVLDASPLSGQVRALPGLASNPGMLAKGLWYAGWLRSHGVPVHTGIRLIEARGDSRVQSLCWEAQSGDPTSKRETVCDAIGFAYGLRSETQLASLLGCEFQFDDQAHTWLPSRDTMGRTSRPAIYVAGDGAGIEGADAAAVRGHQAALALLVDAGFTPDSATISRSAKKRQSFVKARCALERAFPLPSNWAAGVDDSLIICRCEEITAGEIRRVVRDAGAHEINRVKALSRVGMGRCQSRMCGLAAAEIVALEAGINIRQVGYIRSQPPIKPLMVGLVRTAPTRDLVAEAVND